MKVFLCVWHVKRTWLKNLKQKVPGKDKFRIREAILKEISAILEQLDLAKAKEMMQAFCKKWVRPYPSDLSSALSCRMLALFRQ